MTKHIGSLTVTAANREQCKGITEVTGSLYIRADASLPVLASVGGSLYIRAGKFDAPLLDTLHANKGSLLAVSRYGLWLSRDGYYFAGCRGPLTLPQALAHWNRADERAVIFTAAIKAAQVPA